MNKVNDDLIKTGYIDPNWADRWCDSNCVTRRILKMLGLVSDVLCCRGVNDVIGYVGRVITDAFQTARD